VEAFLDKEGVSCVEDLGDFYTSAELMGELKDSTGKLVYERFLNARLRTVVLNTAATATAVSFLEVMAHARMATIDTGRPKVLENESESDSVSSACGPSVMARIAELERKREERKGTGVARRKLNELMREEARIDHRYNEIAGTSVRFCL
jgi:hypothetical protein